MIVFNKVDDITTDEQKESIWEWCKDHVEAFGAVPMDYIEYDEELEDDITINYDQMLSALTDEQLSELNTLIDEHEAGLSLPIM